MAKKATTKTKQAKPTISIDEVARFTATDIYALEDVDAIVEKFFAASPECDPVRVHRPPVVYRLYRGTVDGRNFAVLANVGESAAGQRVTVIEIYPE